MYVFVERKKKSASRNRRNVRGKEAEQSTKTVTRRRNHILHAAAVRQRLRVKTWPTNLL